ncbi:MAG: PEP-CTERM sorting domain-containing protein [Vicinamibacterales bacterium]
MNTWRKYLATAAMAVAALAWGAKANAATIFLIGSDVISFHGDADFINPVMDQIGNYTGTPGNKVLFLSDWGASSTNYTNGNVSIDFAAASSITSSSDLSGYAGIYIDSPSGCCSDPAPTLTGAGAGTALQSYFAAGGNIAVGDYAGDPFWDPILGFAGGPGVTTGIGGIICEDPGVSTASGLAFGFAASYSEGCFNHQSYDPAYFGAQGYFALQTNGNTSGGHFGDWTVIATGFTEPGTEETPVPEPTTLLLLGSGLLVAGRRRVIRRKH